ncbi:glutamate-cysteine ligase family protein [Nocardioides marmoribigeumensis]|uniref:glutamate--cysteine ligase n=1 Tax=Nocardioides marmoribigeumensis TaxID=433649 RepID=A0ABU2BVI6_9ACTN|nr:glutamate-cysteine ligase family protein [Nocardioides marmoribigeumensis]MDR7362635.1 glutamate--cysteine ligase [Nocardioides marmoribigeumensis]
MDRTEIRSLVGAIFAARSSRTTRVAVEQEHLAVDLLRGGTVAPDRVRPVVAGRPYADLVSFEPGGQVELSLRPAPGPTAMRLDLLGATRAIAADLAEHGIALVAAPEWHLASRRHLHSPRYDAMERHFDSIGPAGRRMMRSTASTQVCLDWWPGRAGLEQWELLLLAGPFLAAAVCRSGRLATWLEVDPGRTAFDDRLLHGDDPVRAYADFAAGAHVFVDGGAAEHLTTLFPPVRPRRGYLEVRFPDARPAEQVEPLVAGLAALLYDDQRRRSALDGLRGERPRLADHWRAAADRRLCLARGLELLGAAAEEVAA